MFRLETFGGLVVLDEAGTEVATQPRRLALLALLAVAGARGMPRAKVQAFLWPESSTESARHGLEQLLYYLRRQLAPDTFLGQDPLHLNPRVITSDVAGFEHALASEALADAAAQYRGPFLDGFFVNGAPEFEHWAEHERGQLAEAYRDVLRRLAEAEGARGRHAEAIGWWRKLVASDPLSGRAALGLMRSLAAAGDGPEVVRYARSYVTLLREELGTVPPPEVTAYLAEIHTRPAQPGGSARESSSKGELPGSPLPLQLPVGEPGAAVDYLAVNEPAGRKRSGIRVSQRLFTFGGGLGGAAAVAAAVVLGLRSSDPPSLDQNLIVVAPFDVLGTGPDLWREGMVDALSRSLNGAGPFRTVAPTVVVTQWSGRADHPSAGKLAHRTGAGLAVYGSLLPTAGDSARLGATLLDVRAGRVLLEIELRDAADRMDHLVDSVAVRLLGELGRTRDLGLPRPVRVSSLPLLKEFLQGEQYFRRMDWDSAQLHFERAVTLDSTFAPALRHLAEVQRWKFGAEDSFQLYAFRAAAWSRGASPRESLLIIADSLEAAFWHSRSDSVAVRTARREVATWEEAARRYPADPEAWYGLGEARFHLGSEIGVTLRQQLFAFDRAIAIDSGFLQSDPHAVSLAIQLGGAKLGRRYTAAYLSRNPSGDHALGVRIVNALLTGPALDSAALRRWADSAQVGKVFERVAEALGHWPDSAESGLRLARLVLAGEGSARDSLTPSMLAIWLASRGHLRDAGKVLGSSPTARWPHVFVDLALAGAVPAESAVVAFERWRRLEGVVSARAGTTFLMTLAIPWWAANGDTLTLRQILHLGQSRAQRDADGDRRAAWRYMADAALAYLALAVGDSSEALRRFEELPDCLECDFDRLQTARMLAAAGRDREAHQRLEAVFPTEIKRPPRPSEIFWVLERGRVAQRRGDWRSAAEAYAWVADIWRHADPELRLHVAEARASLERISGGARR